MGSTTPTFIVPVLIVLLLCTSFSEAGNPSFCSNSGGLSVVNNPGCFAPASSLIQAPRIEGGNTRVTFSMSLFQSYFIYDVLPYQTYYFSACNGNGGLNVNTPLSRLGIAIYSQDRGLSSFTLVGGSQNLASCVNPGSCDDGIFASDPTAPTPAFVFRSNDVSKSTWLIYLYDTNPQFDSEGILICGYSQVQIQMSLKYSCSASYTTQDLFEPLIYPLTAISSGRDLTGTSYDRENAFIGCPASYPFGSQIAWVIDGTASNYIGVSLKFLTFDLEKFSDYVSIYQNYVQKDNLVYQYTGRHIPGTEEVYVEFPRVVVVFTSDTLGPNSEYFNNGFLLQVNFDTPCKKNPSRSVNQYVSYQPFAHIGCTGGVDENLDVKYYIEPLTIYNSGSEINIVFTDWNLNSGSTVSVGRVNQNLADSTIIASFIGNAYTLDLPPPVVATNAGEFVYLRLTTDGLSNGYGFGFNYGYIDQDHSGDSGCTAIDTFGNSDYTPFTKFGFRFTLTPTSAAFSCQSFSMNVGTVFYLLQNTGDFLNSRIGFDYDYDLSFVFVFVYDGATVEQTYFLEFSGQGSGTDISSGGELLLAFSSIFDGANNNLVISFFTEDDICAVSGSNFFNPEYSPLNTIGCPGGMDGGLEIFFYIIGIFDYESNKRYDFEDGLITLSFTYFDLGTTDNYMIIYDGFYYYGDGYFPYQPLPYSRVGTFYGNTLPPATESSIPFLTMEVNTGSPNNGFVAVYTIYDGVDPCINSAALTYYAPFGSIWCDAAMDDSNGDTVVTNYFINPNNGLIQVTLNYFYFLPSTSYDNAFIAFYAGSQDTDPQLGLVFPIEANDNGYYYTDPYGTNYASSFRYVADVVLMKFSSSVNPTYFHASYASRDISCTASSSAPILFTVNEGHFGCAGIEGDLTIEYIISPAHNSAEIILDFQYFRLSKGTDYLEIYDGTDSTGVLRYRFTGHIIPPQIISKTDSLYLRVVMTSGETGGGYLVHYYTESFCTTSKTVKVSAPQNNIACIGNLAANIQSTIVLEPLSGYISFSWNILNFYGVWALVDSNSIYSLNDILYSDFGFDELTIIPPGPYVTNAKALTFIFQTILDFAPINSSVNLGFSFTYTAINRLQELEYQESEAVSIYAPENPGPSTTYGSINWVAGVTSSYYIAPTDYGRISINSNLDIQSGDVILIYDGPSQEYPLLKSYTGPLLDNSDIVVTDGFSALIIVSIAKTSVLPGYTFTYSTLTSPCIGNSNTNLNVQLSRPFGFFGCPNGIDNFVTSSWTISPDNGPIDLEFLYLNLEEGRDTLLVYDGPDNTFPLQATYSGAYIPPAFKSTYDTLFLQLTTDETVLSRGFLGKYSTSDPCYITNSATTLTAVADSFGCDRGLAANIRSTWLITPNNGIIYLKFTKFNLQNQFSVDGNAYVYVYDGTSESGTLLGKFTGNNLPSDITSQSNSLFVVLETGDQNLKSQGFLASYVTYGIVDPCTTSQSIVLTGTSATITCDPFARGVVSSWLITPLDGLIDITFVATDFTLLAGDSITIFDGATESAPVLVMITSANVNAIPTAYQTTGQVALVVLSAGGVKRAFAEKFTLHYDTVGSPCTKSGTFTVTEPAGTLSCSSINNNINSNYVIAPNNGLITVAFSVFNFEDGDYLSIVDGTTTLTYGGNNLPPDYTSNGNTVTIVIETDPSIRSKGFTLTYISSGDPCATSAALSLTAQAFTFGCNGMSAALTSSWTITPPNTGGSIDLALISFDTSGTSTLTAFDAIVNVYGGTSTTAPLLLTLDSSTASTFRFNQDTGYTQLFVTLQTTLATADSFYFLYAAGVNDICLTSGTKILNDESATFGCYYGLADDLNSSWLVQPTSQTTISTFSVTLGDGSANSWDDGFDVVTVFNGVDSTAPIALQTNTAGTTLVTVGSTAFVSVITDTEVKSRYLEIFYATSSTDFCAISTASSLQASSTSANVQCNALGNNVQSTISFTTISGAVSDRIIFTPIFINTEANYDFITIYDGPNAASPQLAKYSGNLLALAPISTTSNTAFLSIFTDGDTPSEGFNIAYVTSGDPCIVPTSVNIGPTPSSGRFGCSDIQVPSSGSAFVSTFVVTASTGNVVYLAFEELDFPAGTLTVTEGGTQVFTATGNILPKPYTSTLNQVTVQISITRPGTFFILWSSVASGTSVPTLPSVVPSPPTPPGATSPNPAPPGVQSEPTINPSSTASAAPRQASNSPPPGASFPTAPSFNPFTPPSITPTMSRSDSKSPTPSISTSYTETRTATASPASSPLVSRTSEFLNVRTRFSCTTSIDQCCADFTSLWSALSDINSAILVVPKVCQEITSDTIIEVVFEQYGSNFYTVATILNDYWANAGCGDQDPLNDGPCTPSTTLLDTVDWDEVFLLEVVEEDQYTTDYNTSAAVESTYNPLDSTEQPVFTSDASILFTSSLLLLLVLIL